MMVKERVTEALGPIKFTVSFGCSGGSVNQYLISGAYPGLLNGIQTACTVPDWFTTGMDGMDCNLLAHYFNSTSPQLWANAAQRQAVDGTLTPTTCAVTDLLTS